MNFRSVQAMTTLVLLAFGGTASFALPTSTTASSALDDEKISNTVVPNGNFGLAIDSKVFAGRLAESSGRHGDALHYYSQAALCVPFSPGKSSENFRIFFLRKALAEGVING